jgi:hypothetical protein
MNQITKFNFIIKFITEEPLSFFKWITLITLPFITACIGLFNYQWSIVAYLYYPVTLGNLLLSVTLITCFYACINADYKREIAKI